MQGSWTLAHGRLKKALSHQRRSERGSARLLGMRTDETEAIRTKRLQDPICSISGAVEASDPNQPSAPLLLGRGGVDARHCLLVLSRPHPKKGRSAPVQAMARRLADPVRLIPGNRH